MVASPLPPTPVMDVLSLIGAWTQDDWLDDEAGGPYYPGPSTTQFDSAPLVHAADSADLYVGAWVCFPTHDIPRRERQIEAYTPTTGTVHFPTYAVAVPIVSGERFQLWTRWRPRDVEEQIIRAQRSMYAPTTLRLTGADLDGRRQIDLTALAPALQTAQQVTGIREVAGDLGARTFPYVPGTDFEFYLQGGHLAVLLNLATQTYTTDKTLGVDYWARYSDLTPIRAAHLATDATAADAEWLAWETIWRMSRATAYRDPDLEQQALQALYGYRSQYQPQQGYLAFDRRPAWGPSGWGSY